MSTVVFIYLTNWKMTQLFQSAASVLNVTQEEDTSLVNTRRELLTLAQLQGDDQTTIPESQFPNITLGMLQNANDYNNFRNVWNHIQLLVKRLGAL